MSWYKSLKNRVSNYFEEMKDIDESYGNRTQIVGGLVPIGMVGLIGFGGPVVTFAIAGAFALSLTPAGREMFNDVCSVISGDAFRSPKNQYAHAAQAVRDRIPDIQSRCNLKGVGDDMSASINLKGLRRTQIDMMEGLFKKNEIPSSAVRVTMDYQGNKTGIKIVGEEHIRNLYKDGIVSREEAPDNFKIKKPKSQPGLEQQPQQPYQFGTKWAHGKTKAGEEIVRMPIDELQPAQIDKLKANLKRLGIPEKAITERDSLAMGCRSLRITGEENIRILMEAKKIPGPENDFSRNVARKYSMERARDEVAVAVSRADDLGSTRVLARQSNRSRGEGRI